VLFFPYYNQPESKDCGATCLRIISKFYGKNIPLEDLRVLSKTTREGASLSGLLEAAESLGFKTLGSEVDFTTLKDDAPLPCIVHWNKQHYVVVYKISNKKIFIADPAIGKIKYNHEDFYKYWAYEESDSGEKKGIALFFEPTQVFEQNKYTSKKGQTNTFNYINKHFKANKKLVTYLIFALIAENILAFFFPFFTKNIVDKGIKPKDINYIYLILIAQLSIFLGQITIGVIRSHILLHLSTKINIKLISDFLKKMMKLPISFFDTRLTGDLLQRMNDNYRIQQFLTGNSLDTLFSILHFIVFGSILFYYNFTIFIAFFLGSLLYIFWLIFFAQKRKILDYKRFAQQSQERSKTLEIVSGMQEIKINSAENQKTKEWEKIQENLYKTQIEVLKTEQWQSVGSTLIGQLKDIFITFFSATLVIQNKLTIGEMISIQYIIGQLNVPLSQLIYFVRSFQDTKISIERLNEIHSKNNEDENVQPGTLKIESNSIHCENISFSYFGTEKALFENLSLHIPKNKITAIVGTSGSGKTTLIKLLLKFYNPTSGIIWWKNTDLKSIVSKDWRKSIGVVMQDGFIFNDTIAKNITIGYDEIDKERLDYAVKTANLENFILDLPLQLNTLIGNDGHGISGGQKQRILIARAVYKNPEFIFFDEATSALDAENEKIVHNNLQEFFRGKTVVIVAHRLSTVKNADNIVVLKNGKIAEQGNHIQLTKSRADYYNLVKNQLELGN